MSNLQAPFPYFGGKQRIAAEIWRRLGDVPNYVEPFFGSGAVLLHRPGWSADRRWIETANDADGFVCNFYRAIQQDPLETADHADQPVNENDLQAWHVELRERARLLDLPARLEGDPQFCDPEIAGRWCWGLCCWIGGGWCGPSGEGPWQRVDGKLQRTGAKGGVVRQRPHLGDAGVGVIRKRPQLSGVYGAGRGVTKHLRGDQPIHGWFQSLSDRLRRVRVCCGDWSRVCTRAVTTDRDLTGVFLDPPYGTLATRVDGIYRVDTLDVADKARDWAIEHADDPLFRIALCGYEGEHDMPDTWECVAWKSKGGYGSQGDGQGKINRQRERVWFSPLCLHPETQGVLF